MADNNNENATAYWKANVRLIVWSLVAWAFAAYGQGIILRPMLMGIHIGGADIGFWFAQQGSIITFLLIIFHYAWRMNKLDKEFGVEE